MESIADAVSGATTATVERVLEKYGDPVADEAGEAPPAVEDDPSTNEGPAATDGGATPEVTESAVANEPTTHAEQEPAQPSEPVLDRSGLTEKQRETLRAIYDHPEATQAELADRLGVSSPTISQRVNSIDGFDWSNRDALVEQLFDADDGTEQANDRGGQGDVNGRVDDSDEPQQPTDDSDGDGETVAETTVDSPADSSENGRQRAEPDASRSERADQPVDQSSDGTLDDGQQLTALGEQVDELAQRLSTVERELEGRKTARDTEPSVLADSELAHKIVHACVHSDRITEDEELRLLRDVTTAGATPQSNQNGTESTYSSH